MIDFSNTKHLFAFFIFGKLSANIKMGIKSQYHISHNLIWWKTLYFSIVTIQLLTRILLECFYSLTPSSNCDLHNHCNPTFNLDPKSNPHPKFYTSLKSRSHCYHLRSSFFVLYYFEAMVFISIEKQEHICTSSLTQTDSAEGQPWPLALENTAALALVSHASAPPTQPPTRRVSSIASWVQSLPASCTPQAGCSNMELGSAWHLISHC